MMKHANPHDLMMSRLSALLLVVSILGCNDPSDTTQPGNPSDSHAGPNSADRPAAVRKIVPTTPEKAVQAYQRAMGNQDWDGCWALLHGRTQQTYRDRASEFLQTLGTTRDGPDLRALERRLADMGLTLREARRMTGKMLMTGLLRSQFKNDPEGFGAFVEAECLDHQQMGRQAVVSLRVRGLLQPRQVMTRRYGVLWYVYEEPPEFP